MQAVRSRDVTALAQVLTADAVALADGGGKVTALPRPLHGNEVIARALIAFALRPASRGWRLVPTQVNGLPGYLLFDDLAGGCLVQAVALAPSASEPGRVGARCTSSAIRTSCARSRVGNRPTRRTSEIGMFDLRGNRVLIAGGSSGVGLATAELLVELRRGGRCQWPRPRQAGKGEGPTGRKASIAAFDAANPRERNRAFATLGSFDHLVVALSGGKGAGPFTETSATDRAQRIRCQVLGAFLAGTRVDRSSQPGRVHNLRLGHIGTRGQSGYCWPCRNQLSH